MLIRDGVCDFAAFAVVQGREGYSLVARSVQELSVSAPTSPSDACPRCGMTWGTEDRRTSSPGSCQTCFVADLPHQTQHPAPGAGLQGLERVLNNRL
jgi:hypothetical protein